MLITFTGKGCNDCPFLNEYLNIRLETAHKCGLDGRQEEGIIVPISALITDIDHRPAGCPFEDSIGSLEVTNID